MRLDVVSKIAIPAPPERVWAVFADAARWPEVSRVVAEVSVAPDRWEPGARLAFRLRIGGAVVPFDVRITEADPPHRVVWTSVRWTVTGTRTHTFEPTADGTLATDHKRFEHAVVPLRWVYPRAVIRRMSEAWLADLAAAVRSAP